MANTPRIISRRNVVAGLAALLAAPAVARADTGGFFSNLLASAEHDADAASKGSALGDFFKPAADSSSSADAASSADYGLLTSGMLTVGTSPDYPPFESLDDDNRCVGFDMSLIEALADELGLTVTYVDLPFDGLLLSLEKGECDCVISGISVSPARSDYVDFCQPYFRDEPVFAYLPGQTAIDFENFDLDAGLAGRTVGVQAGSFEESYLSAAAPSAMLVSYDTVGKLLMACDAGEVDAACFNRTNATSTFFNEDFTLQNDRLILYAPDPATTSDYSSEYAIAVAKGNTGLAQALDMAFVAIDKDGTLDAILADYPDVFRGGVVRRAQDDEK